MSKVFLAIGAIAIQISFALNLHPSEYPMEYILPEDREAKQSAEVQVSQRDEDKELHSEVASLLESAIKNETEGEKHGDGYVK